MVDLPDVFKSKDHGSMGFDVLPDVDEDGNKIKYLVKIIKSEKKKNKSGEGYNFPFQLKVQAGPKKGRLIFARLNLINKNTTTVEIAQAELADMCRACGKETIKETSELHGIEFYVELKITEETESWPAGNEVSKYINAKDVSGEGDSPFKS